MHIKFHRSVHRVPLEIVPFGAKIHNGSFSGWYRLGKFFSPNSNILYIKRKIITFYKNKYVLQWTENKNTKWRHLAGFYWSILMFSKVYHIRYQMKVNFVLIILQKGLGLKNEQRIRLGKINNGGILRDLFVLDICRHMQTCRQLRCT